MEAPGDIFLGFGFIAIVSFCVMRGTIISRLIGPRFSFLNSRRSPYRPRMVAWLEVRTQSVLRSGWVFGWQSGNSISFRSRVSEFELE